MRLPLSWLRDYLPLEAAPSEVAARLGAAGFEVEEVETFGEGCKGLVVGMVLDFGPHPRADRLRLCKVDYGVGAAVDVVCGASNFEVGDKVAFAPPGAELPGGVKVEARTIRGVRSEGMICSEAELGIGPDAEGIMVLASGAQEAAQGLEVGTPLEDVLGLGDTVLEVSITPNRPDAMSVLGLARELSASFGVDYSYPSVDLREEGPPCNERVSVEIAEPDRCPRYVARFVEGVRVGPSPLWMATRLREAGARPINNVVDVTNFVLMEVGHPLHAFDYSKVSGGKVVVRLAADGERLVALDGQEYVLTQDDLVIADTSRALALAGVIGGEESGISAETTDVLLESAYFEPTGILRTSKRHSVRTESSARFERGCDPEGAMWASRRAAALLAELAGGRVGRGAVDAYPKRVASAKIRLRTSRTEKLLGVAIPPERQAALLSSIGLRVTPSDGDVLEVEVPTFRPDLTREVDLVEEVGRLHGYDKVKKTLPASAARVGRLDPLQRKRRLVAEIVRGCGFTEVKNFSMLAPEEVPPHLESSVSRLSNPLRVEESVLRPSLIPGLLKSAALNLSRRKQDIRLFEVGTVFGPPDENGIPAEHRSLGGVVVLAASRGRGIPAGGISDLTAAPEFFEAKGALEALFETGGVEGVTYRPEELGWMHPVRAAAVVIGTERLGFVAEVSQEAAERFGIASRVGVFEVDLDHLCELFGAEKLYRAFSKFPPVYFDLSFVVDEDVLVSDLISLVYSVGGEAVERCDLMDVYRSEKFGEGRKSVTVTVSLAALDHTLTDEEAGRLRTLIIAAVEERLGGHLRGA